MKSFIGEGTGVEPEDNRQLPSRPWAPGSGQACRKKHSRISLIPGWRRKFARCYTKRIELVCTKESSPRPPPPDPRPPHLAQPGAPQTKAAEPATTSFSGEQNPRGSGKTQRSTAFALWSVSGDSWAAIPEPGDIPPSLLLGFIRSRG